MNAGTLRKGGKLCNTDLYFNGRDEDHRCGSTIGQDTFGPHWSVSNNRGCPMDDPGITSSLGPSALTGNREYQGATAAVGFGGALNLNINPRNAGRNYMWVFVRESKP